MLGLVSIALQALFRTPNRVNDATLFRLPSEERLLRYGDLAAPAPPGRDVLHAP